MRTALFSIMLAAAICLAAGACSSVSAQKNKTNPKLAREATITLNQARVTALKRADGTVEESELEKEHGKLVYSFDIRNAKGTITEVQVDAKTGEIAAVEEEDAAAEAKEKRKDKKHN